MIIWHLVPGPQLMLPCQYSPSRNLGLMHCPRTRVLSLCQNECRFPQGTGLISEDPSLVQFCLGAHYPANVLVSACVSSQHLRFSTFVLCFKKQILCGDHPAWQVQLLLRVCRLW